MRLSRGYHLASSSGSPQCPSPRWRLCSSVDWAETNIGETLKFYRLPRAQHKHRRSRNKRQCIRACCVPAIRDSGSFILMFYGSLAGHPVFAVCSKVNEPLSS
ncbi:hypothetical protein C0Z20_00050 [Trinickia symbiotica]|uniref:Uncharacterized protein n=1 Tax=Trinickia symbiotica TaxID=863227 RepID=A0A2N7X9A3_9BURK|nr:hypothetical protein C0Z20_00050 [Trinickia symbiotica]